MGLNEHFLHLMIGLKTEGKLSGHRVVELGAQQLGDAFLKDKKSIADLAALYGRTPDHLPKLPESAAGIAPGHEPYSRSFYEALGYEYAAVDIDGSPNSIPLDLNYDPVPANYVGRFDLVTNFGTTEHVINQLNAFKVIHDLAAPGAVMLHEVPAQGLINHGLFNYNPKFFQKLAQNNAYETLFFDYRWTEIRPGLPDDVRFLIERYVSPRGRPLCGISEAVLFVAQRKTTHGAFVPPLDVPMGSRPPSDVIADRYGPVYKPPLRSIPGRYLRRAVSLFAGR